MVFICVNLIVGRMGSGRGRRVNEYRSGRRAGHLEILGKIQIIVVPVHGLMIRVNIPNSVSQVNHSTHQIPHSSYVGVGAVVVELHVIIITVNAGKYSSSSILPDILHL